MLTDPELAELRKAREQVWSDWVELERVPSAEYQEHLILLDGDAVTNIRAENGFRENTVAGALAHRLRALSK